MKGFQKLIPMMKYLPEVDLRIAGTGPFERELSALAEGLPNVRLRGASRRRGAGQAVSRGAGGRRAVAVPGDVRVRRPGGVRRPDAGRGPPRRRARSPRPASRAAAASGTRPIRRCSSRCERIVHDDGLRRELADAGYAMRQGPWSEDAHLRAYFDLIQRCRPRKAAAPRLTREPSGTVRRRRPSR